MSYFDNNGSDADEEDKKSDSSSISDTDTETNIDENEVDIEDDEDVAEGKDTDNESDEEDDKDKKIDYKKQFGVDFASDDEEEEDNDNDADSEKAPGSDQEQEEDMPVVSKKKSKKIPTRQKSQAIVYDEEDDEDPTGEVYLQKFDKEINDNYLVNVHPESAVHNYDEILAMTKVVRDKNGIIIDDLHKTIPYLTKYEKARILGQRAKQINSGATVFVKVPEKVIDGYLIAELELQEKRVPFIIRRPMPNGGSEYWSIKDLENISF
jgi:DNA-directed RNA polymerase I, II, and III subunit RPABC2